MQPYQHVRREGSSDNQHLMMVSASPRQCQRARRCSKQVGVVDCDETLAQRISTEWEPTLALI
eukprot:8142510-Karenia_brevis.AAC.1